MSTAAVATAREDEPSPNTITTGDGDKKSFADLYDLDKELGRGAFSVVKLGHSKASQEEFAIKIITKAEMHDFDKACLKNELAVMQTLLPPHEHIVRLFDVHEEDQFWYLVLEKVNGGELLDRLIAKNTYSECEARDVSKIVMEAMRHCHDHNICHRDLKPENLLLASPTDDSTIKVADFGFAKLCPSEGLKTQCGSAMHVAPELLRKESYTCKLDSWALGVVMFTTIGGYPPFYDGNNQGIFKKILKGEFEYDPQYWGHVSQDCKDMISGLLTMDVDKRWSTQQCCDCQWMKDDPVQLRRTSMMVNVKKLREFNAKRKFKGVVHALQFAKRHLSFDHQEASAPHRESILMMQKEKPSGEEETLRRSHRDSILDRPNDLKKLQEELEAAGADL